MTSLRDSSTSVKTRPDSLGRVTSDADASGRSARSSTWRSCAPSRGRASCRRPPGRRSSRSGGPSRWAGSPAPTSWAPAWCCTARSRCRWRGSTALAGLPARGSGHRLGGRRPRRLAGADGQAPEAPGRLRGADGPARRHPPLVGRAGQGGHRRRRRTPPRRPRSHPPRAGRRARGLRSCSSWGGGCRASRRGRLRGRASPATTSRSRSSAPTARPLTEADVLAGMNQQWRRNIKKADKAGVVVDRSADRRDSRATSRRSTTSTCTPPSATTSRRGRSATSAPWSRPCAAEDPDRITLWLAHHEGDLVAATIAVRVGTHAWYSYGASSTEKRDVRGSNAVQWAMMRDALASRGDRLRPARHHRHPRPRRPARRA